MDGAYLPRHLVAEVGEALASARVVDLAGKTTLVRDMLGHGRFMTLDDSAALSAIDADPLGQLSSFREDVRSAPLTIDEAQRSKALALAVKRDVDRDR